MSIHPDIVALPSRGVLHPARIVTAHAAEPFVQCEQPAAEQEGWYRRDHRNRYVAEGLDPDRCFRNARYQIGERRLCAQHAGGLLLDLALHLSFHAEQQAFSTSSEDPARSPRANCAPATPGRGDLPAHRG